MGGLTKERAQFGGGGNEGGGIYEVLKDSGYRVRTNSCVGRFWTARARSNKKGKRGVCEAEVGVRED